MRKHTRDNPVFQLFNLEVAVDDSDKEVEVEINSEDSTFTSIYIQVLLQTPHHFPPFSLTFPLLSPPLPFLT
jgi:DNA-directed RNA polymerase subunit L